MTTAAKENKQVYPESANKVFHCCSTNDLLNLKQLLQKYPQYQNIENSKGFTPLITAIYAQNDSIIEYLISLFISTLNYNFIQYRTSIGLSAIYAFISHYKYNQSKKEAWIHQLLKEPISCNPNMIGPNGFHLIHYAIENADIHSFSILLESSNFRYDIKQPLSQFNLCHCLIHEHSKYLESKARNGTQKSSEDQKINEFKKRIQLKYLSIPSNSDINIFIKMFKRLLAYATQNKFNTDVYFIQYDSYERTPLYYAIILRTYSFASLVLNFGSKECVNQINIMSDKKWTIAHLIYYQFCNDLQSKFFDLLDEYNAKLSVKDVNGMFPIMVAQNALQNQSSYGTKTELEENETKIDDDDGIDISPYLITESLMNRHGSIESGSECLVDNYYVTIADFSVVGHVWKRVSDNFIWTYLRNFYSKY